jgi:hypothetical protein
VVGTCVPNGSNQDGSGISFNKAQIDKAVKCRKRFTRAGSEANGGKREIRVIKNRHMS